MAYQPIRDLFVIVVGLTKGCCRCLLICLVVGIDGWLV
jgi:hypothetical protein